MGGGQHGLDSLSDGSAIGRQGGGGGGFFVRERFSDLEEAMIWSAMFLALIPTTEEPFNWQGTCASKSFWGRPC